MKKFFLLFVLLTSSLFVFGQLDSFNLDFNNYEFGDIGGQDGWRSIDQHSGGKDHYIDVNTYNGTNGVFFTASGPNVGRTITRKDFGDLSFDFSQGGKLEIEWEMQSNWWGQWLAIGFDKDNDGHLAHNLDITEEKSAALVLSMSNATKLYTLSSGLNSIDFTPLDSENSYIQYKLVLDLSANEGSGKAALYYRDGDFTGSWFAVPEIQGYDLQLTPDSGKYLDPAKWDAFSFHAQGGNSILDNLVFRMEPDDGLQSQFIDFPQIEKQFTSNAPIDLIATSYSGLPVSFEILSGPASIESGKLTFDGTEGFVEIMVSQEGDGVLWSPATPSIQVFQVIDPLLYSPALMVRNPVNERTVIMPELSAFLMTASSFIDHEDVLSIEKVIFEIDGQTLEGKDWGTGYYTTYWTPSAYGNYNLNVSAISSEGTTTTNIVDFDVVELSEDLTFVLIEDLRAGVADTNIVFPSYVGAFESVKLILEYDCPSDGCEPWDRINQQFVQGPTGEWIGFMRYITPYGVACSDEQDITDYMSLFQGNVRLRLPYEWRSVISIRLEYKAGISANKYSWVDKVWVNNVNGYSFGNFENLQTIPEVDFNLKANLEEAKLTIINSGHGWGENNSNNAAEFSKNTHNIKVNGNTKYQHTPWESCNPNPAGCMPQNGTWYHDRAGWCPGTLVPVESFDLTEFIGGSLKLHYELDPSYIDYCSPNNPDCINGVTCPNCDEPYGPTLVLDAHLITFANTPLENSINNVEKLLEKIDLVVLPNPNKGNFTIHTNASFGKANLVIFNAVGKKVYEKNWNSDFDYKKNIDLSHLDNGVYYLNLRSKDGFGTHKILIQ